MIQASNSVNFTQNVKTYHGFAGWVRAVFGRAVRVVTDRGDVLYLHKASLLKKICEAANLSSKKVDRKKLANLMIEVLNPVKGLPITIQKVEGLFRDVASAFKGQKGSAKQLAEKFEQLKNRHLTVLPYDAENLKKILKVGDIIFKKNGDEAHSIVVLGQKLFKDFSLSPITDREGYKYSHAAIYLGDGQIAEATPSKGGGVQVRVLNLDDPRFALDTQEGQSYVVSRPANEELAMKAAEVARSITKPAIPFGEEQKNDHKHKYTNLNALRSLWHVNTFGPFAKRRYLQQFVEYRKGEAPREIVKFKDFYCSSFVAHCFQTAESQTVVPKILANSSNPRSGLKALDKHVQMRFDAQWMTPQGLRHFMKANPALFQDMYAVTP